MRGTSKDEIATLVSWFLAGVATALAGGIVFVLTRDVRLAVPTGAAVLGVLRLAHAAAR
jgi:hypothetical protein